MKTPLPYMIATCSLIILVMYAVVQLTGCVDNRPQQKIAKTLDQGGIESDLVRYQDLENKVTCYRVRGYEGISCLRKEKTDE